MRARTSLRLRSSFRKMPIIRLVVIITPGVFTPRALMHAWLASMTTATPLGSRCSQMQSATCAVSRSCTCSRRKAVQHARQFADADDLVARQISDRRLADDRRHVVLAMRLERDVLQQHDLVVTA